jgi:hypothetical protein
LDLQALLLEFLLAAFFAVACFKARAENAPDLRIAPRKLFVLTDRLERLRRSRWQWCSMVLLLVLIRTQKGAPMVAELTALTQFVVFLMLPSATPAKRAVAAR